MEYLFLGLAIALVLGFEFVNGFHDTANAVATVIYTNTLKPVYAVVWSGLWNLLGVLTSSGTVAFAIVSLLPADLMVNDSSDSSLIMVLALLISAIIWNLGTWYLGLPVSSTHSLIGAITGIAIAHSLLSLERNWWNGINASKMQEVLVSLLVSPLLGFCGAVILFLISKALFQREELYSPPSEKEPPLWIRAILVLTCTGVSFAHGSNDGQKGVGLMMLILIVFLPNLFALNLDTSPQAIARLVATSNSVIPIFESQIRGTSLIEASSDELIANSRAELTKFLQPEGQLNENIWRSLISESQSVNEYLSQSDNLRDIAIGDRRQVRNDLYLMSMAIGKIGKLETPAKLANLQNQDVIIDFKNQLDRILKFIPYWVKVAIAIALGLGTMIGWQRVVVTVGEKIGTEHLNYAQGATSEMVTMTAIATANYFGLPVSTTHILSSGIAGTMVANRAGLQIDTVKKLLLAWILTLPSCIFLGFITYAIGLFVIHH
ncbi:MULTISPECIES: inorganic phosphate transporter [Pseudanabaena]|uniref:Phosphate transporter n=2 Tax=Pseudanabaena TaxID=1152 RepID=L8MYJ0_9CYAN|nr:MULTISPECIES: inorganic phosphate transporter [Pseudanabaena]ELS31525.1 phosphate transporter [Pseudanabaena biceps PCC 7429]MDG3496225.1 inorganic phosphate transporter [Pseudanabaena catenata USMAC16]